MLKLEDYMKSNSEALSRFAMSRTNPVHVPGRDTCLDFSDLMREPVSGQRHVITAGVKALDRMKSLFYVCATGTGKTLVSIATIHKHRFFPRGYSQTTLPYKPYRVLVFCPGQLVKKWKREIEQTVRDAQVRIITSWTDLTKIHPRASRNGSEWWIIGRDRAKLGWGTESGIWVRNGKFYCPHCGQMVECNAKKCNTIITKLGKTVSGCGQKLTTCNRQYNRVAPAWYIKRKMKGFFDYLVLDEVHEERSADSLQGIASGQLAAACGKVITLTGTLVGGLAEHLRPILFRISPGSLIRGGYQWDDKAEFNKAYGRYEVIDTDDGSRRKLVPGIMPSMFGAHLMGKSIFLSLAEVADNLPDKKEIEVPCDLPKKVREEYKDCEEAIREAMGRLMRSKGMGGLGAAISFLMNYPDYPFNWEPIVARDPNRGDEIICDPKNFDQSIVLPKEQQLIELVQSQKERGRACWVYVQNTDKHNVLDRLAALLKRSGLRVNVLRANVKPELREEWIAAKGPYSDVIISHPTLVQTGLDFFSVGRTYNLPTLIFYQVGFNTFQTRQAAGRAWRIGQWERCEVYYMHASDTMQSRNLEIMAKKVAASLSLEGEFSSEGLLAMVGNNQDSAEAMLAKSLVDNAPINLSRVWEKINSAKFREDFFDAW